MSARGIQVGVVVLKHFVHQLSCDDQMVASAVVARLAEALLLGEVQDALSKYQRRLAIATDLIPQLVWSTKPDGSVTWTNQQFLSYTGLSTEEVKDEGWSRTLHPFDFEHTLRAWRTATQTGATYDVECRMRAADGSYRWFLSRGLPVRDERGRIVEWFGADTDINERKLAEQALRWNHALLRIISAAQMQILDQESASEVFHQLLASVMTLTCSSAGLLLERCGDDSVAVLAASAVLAAISQPDTSGEQDALQREAEDIFAAATESTRIRISKVAGQSAGPRIRLLAPLVANGRCVGVLGLSRRDSAFEEADPYGDLTALVLGCGQLVNAHINERQRRLNSEALNALRLELAHASRIMTISQLMVSIAHEVNQPLAAVVASGNACRLWLERDNPNIEEACAAAKSVVKDGERAAEVIRRIRGLIRKAPLERVRFSANELIEEVIAITRGEASKRHTHVQAELDPELPSCEGDRVQIQQVLLNLVLNAIDAVESRAAPRVIRLSTRLLPPALVQVTVEDNGPGFPAQKRQTLFTPFHSTKPSGLGLGLSVSKAIVDAHGGSMAADASELGGARLSLRLPART
jgi:PAS domain S-box-containing protein